MAWTRIHFRGRHFDINNSVMEVWLRLLTDEIDTSDSVPAWLLEVRDEWLLLTTCGACSAPDLDAHITNEERRSLILTLCDRALERLRAMGDPIPPDRLNALHAGPDDSTFTRQVNASVFLDGAESFRNLLLDEGEDNWLDGRELLCEGCGHKLWWVMHSPFCDDHQLYCTRCPRAVSISYYSPEYARLQASAGFGERDYDEAWTALMGMVTANLLPCECGAEFRHDAPRHCLYCGATINEDPAGRDVWPVEPVESEWTSTDEDALIHVPTGRKLVQSAKWKRMAD